jgi:hypothetical protein
MKKYLILILLLIPSLSFAATTISTDIKTSGKIGIGSTTPYSKLSIDASGSDVNPFSIKTNGSAGNYTPTNSGIFMYDAAGRETLRIVASDPDPEGNNYNSQNLFIGKEAGASNPSDNVSSGYFNTGIGYQVLFLNSTGNRNVAIGDQSLYSNTTGLLNTSSGYQSLNSNTTGTFNSAFGAFSSNENTTGSENTAIGGSSLMNNQIGSGNIGLGYFAGAYETGSNTFYVDDQDRTNTAGDKAGALLYGTFNATPASQTLTINASTTIAQNLKVGGNSNSANLQVKNTVNATTTVEMGSSGQNKGSCLKMYRTDGSAIYAYVAAGATTFTLSTTACASVSNF